LGLNQSDNIISMSPTQVGTSSWTAITNINPMQRVAFAIRSGGTLFAWGANNGGGLGDGTIVNRSSPVQIGSSSWNFVASGGDFNFAPKTLALDSNGLLYGWGYGGFLGFGDNNARSSPALINTAGAGFSSPTQVGTSSWRQIAVNRTHAAAIRSDSKLFTWGKNTDGQLGDNSTTTRSSPVQIGTSAWSYVATGSYHTLAIRSDGLLFSWGQGLFGKLGLNGDPFEAPSESSPTQVGTSSWLLVQGSEFSSAAIRSDNLLFTWGSASNGMLANNNNEGAIPSPIQIGSASWTALSSKYRSALAIRTNGSLWFWGAGQDGRSGVASFTDYSSPVQIGTSSWTSVGAGFLNSAAIRSGGTLFTWGFNGAGALGLGDQNNRSSPTQLGSASWSMVSMGYNSGLAVDSNAKLFAWGVNSQGQLGDNSTTDRSSPVQIGSSSWSLVSAGDKFTGGILYY